ncbi:eukaryotic translation initiation factor 3 subunit A-like [Oppia nitens]|uniref:eukaryotic translation initiation factor 3 subunit A-like n=1 Tax=Oppia nitens TaxID=1686743 RepID=UPI0023DBE504|nr:eukaryotic translation initiation factor 3 subunit A-like [Oppia nitens]
MPIYFHRLGNALKRANEFIDVGKKPRALEILCDVLRSRKHRTWQKEHPDIMMKYLELCVELKKSYVAKEGIYQYKIICQQTYIQSFEEVVRKYIEMAEEKAESAKRESKQTVLDVDDLDNAQTPEDILLSAVSNEDNQDRTDRVVLIPWVKFLWESYRQCLDLLKNNSRTERLYHDIAHQAFKFCINYNRKTEFRKLCDNLHTHLDILKKQQQQQQQVGHQQQNIINLSSPESQAMHLETRLVQLDNAIQMELWQEAYKATDDIKRFGLMNLSKKPPKPQLMANYYQKLSLVFQKANCPLFHSAALFRLFHLSKELRKNITSEDIQKMATRVVTATLAIPIPPNRAEIDKLVDTEENVVEAHQRNLASLLGLTSSVPNRGSLIKDLKRMGVLQCASPKLQELYRYLEIDFHPLVLCGRVQTIIEWMNENTDYPELKQYTTALKDVTAMRLLKEVSQVYQTIEFKRLLELCPFANYTYLEKMVVEAARRNDLQVRIDHRKGCLIFGTELRVSTGEEVIEGPHLQSMPSEQIRKQLVNMYSTLQKARNMIEPDRVKVQREDIKRKIMKAYHMTANEEHIKILRRQGVIEERKEELERLGLKREEEERRKVEEQQLKIRAAEEERMMVEKKEREQQIKLKQDIELKKQMAKDQISMMKGSLGGALLDLDDEELAKMRPEEIQVKRIEQLEKERKDQLSKQRKLERKVDHLERAKRIEEIPLLEKSVEEWKVKDKELWNQMEEERIKEIKEERILALQCRDRLRKVLDDKEIFAQKIIKERHNVFVDKLSEFQTKLDLERKRLLDERREKRKEERRKKYISEKEAEERRIHEEAKRKQDEEREAKFKEQLEKQKQRDFEIEEKIRQKELEREKEFGEKKKKEEEEKRFKVEERDTREPENWRKREEVPRRAPADEDNDWQEINRVKDRDRRDNRRIEKERDTDSWRTPRPTRDNRPPAEGVRRGPADNDSTWRSGGQQDKRFERKDDRRDDRGERSYPRGGDNRRDFRRDDRTEDRRDFRRDDRDDKREFRRDDRGEDKRDDKRLERDGDSRESGSWRMNRPLRENRPPEESRRTQNDDNEWRDGNRDRDRNKFRRDDRRVDDKESDNWRSNRPMRDNRSPMDGQRRSGTGGQADDDNEWRRDDRKAQISK